MLNRPYLFVFFATLVFLLNSCRKDAVPGSADNVNAGGKPAVLTAITENINANTGGFYEALPANYNATSSRYPLLVSLHGADALGEGGADLAKLLDSGLPALLNLQRLPAQFISGKNSYSFIVICPQFKSWPSPEDINAVVDYAVRRYRSDSSRIYIVGQSMGGGAALDYAAVYGKRIAAVVPISGATWLDAGQCSNIAAAALPVWAFHNQDDSIVDASATKGNIEAINRLHPAINAAMTLWATGGHDAWTKATNPATRECNSMNIYEWMLQYRR